MGLGGSPRAQGSTIAHCGDRDTCGRGSRAYSFLWVLLEVAMLELRPGPTQQPVGSGAKPNNHQGQNAAYPSASRLCKVILSPQLPLNTPFETAWASQVALVVKKLSANSGNMRHRIDLWVRKILWRRKWQPMLVFLPWKISWKEEPGRLQSIRIAYSQTWLKSGLALPITGARPSSTHQRAGTFPAHQEVCTSPWTNLTHQGADIRSKSNYRPAACRMETTS